MDTLKGMSSGVGLAPYSWWEIGGIADYFTEVKGQLELEEVVRSTAHATGRRVNQQYQADCAIPLVL